MNKKCKVFELLREVPKDKVTTYKEIASKLGLNPREVGRILSKNEDLEKVKCYKVVRNNGEVGGYKLGIKEKIKRLKKEGIKIKNNKIVDFKEKLYHF